MTFVSVKANEFDQDQTHEEEASFGMTEIIAITICTIVVGSCFLWCVLIIRNSLKHKKKESVPIPVDKKIPLTNDIESNVPLQTVKEESKSDEYDDEVDSVSDEAADSSSGDSEVQKAMD